MESLAALNILGANASASDGNKGFSTTFRTWGSYFGQRGTSKMLYVPTAGALPCKGPFRSRHVDLFENRISLIKDRRQCGDQRLERRVHKFNSSC